MSSSSTSTGSSPRLSPVLSRSTSSISLTSSSSHGQDNAAPKFPSIQTSLPESGSVKTICCVGAGYVGGPTAAVIAFMNPHIRVTVVDRDHKRIRRWQSKHLPIHEPGLSDYVRVARDGTNTVTVTGKGSQVDGTVPARAPNLFFSTECDRYISEADIIYLSVNTPTKVSGIGAGAATNISILESAMRSVALVAKPGAIIVEKSTVPCRTAQVIQDILETTRPGVPFEILSNPEFLAEGTAVNDLLNPARVLIGSANTPSGLAAAAKLVDIYAAWVPSTNILTVHLWSSELAKLVANAMLAQRISSINSISAICEKTGADITDVANAIGLDPRLGSKFLKAGLGFGGSCFKKDILNLTYLAESLDLPEVAAYWRAVVDTNDWQCSRFVKRVIKNLNGSLSGKRITVLGYAFKKDTSDTRESQAINVIRRLLTENPAEISIFDPGCHVQDIEDEMISFFSNDTSDVLKPSGPIKVYADPYEACINATAVLILTDWDQFHYPSQKPSLPKSDSPFMKSTAANVEPTIYKTNVMQMHAAVQGVSYLEDLVQHDLQSDPSRCFRPEPECPEYCRDCARGNLGKSQAEENLRWETIAGLMQQPKWVFDGRGVVDENGMQRLGFRVEVIGKASMRSGLRGFGN